MFVIADATKATISYLRSVAKDGKVTISVDIRDTLIYHSRKAATEVFAAIAPQDQFTFAIHPVGVLTPMQKQIDDLKMEVAVLKTSYAEKVKQLSKVSTWADDLKIGWTCEVLNINKWERGILTKIEDDEIGTVQLLSNPAVEVRTLLQYISPVDDPTDHWANTRYAV